MSTMALQAKAKRHWMQYLPAKTAALKAAGQWEQATQAAALAADERISQLTASGFQYHEAEEVALAEFVLLQPEPEPEDEEAAEREAEYRATMADVMALREATSNL